MLSDDASEAHSHSGSVTETHKLLLRIVKAPMALKLFLSVYASRGETCMCSFSTLGSARRFDKKRGSIFLDVSTVGQAIHKG